jgi:hypothetical protein
MKKIIFILAYFACFGCSGFSQSLTEGLAAYYPFNGDANDASGNNLHLTSNGALLTADKNGNPNSAYLFNGTGSFLFLEDASALVSNAFSMSAWIRANKLPASRGHVSVIDFGSKNIDHCIFITNNYDNKHTGFLTHSYITPGKNVYACENVPVDTYEWYHVAMTRNDIGIKLYKNGVLAAEMAASENPGFETKNSLSVGRRIDGTIPFSGIVDDVRFYTRVLSEQEIALLYSSNTSVRQPETDLSEKKVLIYPNPAASGMFKITSGIPFYDIEVTDIQGKVIITNAALQKETEIDLNLFPKGIYFVKLLTNDKKLLVEKIIFQ